MPFVSTFDGAFDADSIPTSIPVGEFVLNRPEGIKDALPPFVCGITGRQWSAPQVKNRVNQLAVALAYELGWEPNQGSEFDKVVAIYSCNTIDTLTVSWAVHRLSGVVSPVNAAYGEAELASQLVASRAKAIFVSPQLLETALAAAAKCAINPECIFILDAPTEALWELYGVDGFKSVDQLIKAVEALPPIEPLRWHNDQGATQCAFLNFSSGTTGLPKGVMVSHRNVIANVLQMVAFEKNDRKPGQRDVTLGVLPQSHIYGLVMCHLSAYRGDSVVVLPKFDLQAMGEAIQTFKINVLIIVPPIVMAMLNTMTLMRSFNFSSVREVFSGAAPLAVETSQKLLGHYPTWKVRQAYGMTETATVVSCTSISDISLGSCGPLIPGVEAMLLSIKDRSEVTQLGVSGELFLRAPSVTFLGYLGNEKATKETFGIGQNGWLRTGDEAMFITTESGSQHLYIIDRVKELIKVKGHQVAPAELEACLNGHPAIADAAVIPVPDANAGEVPKAFVVLKADWPKLHEGEVASLVQDIHKHVQLEKAAYKWLKGGVEFVEAIPKSPSGKILRRILKDSERQRRRQEGPRI